MSRPCAQCSTPLPSDRPGRGGRQPRRRFCSDKCRNDHRNAAKRVARLVTCGTCGETRTLITQGVEGSMCRACAGRRRTEAAREVNTQPAGERFMRHVRKTASCWLWTGTKQKNGYGSFGFKGRTVRAHRWSYEFHVGQIPDGLHIDHLCRVRNCVNPEHLEPVTHAENMRRAREARA